MKQLDRFSMDHHKVDPPRLHGDLNRLVDQTNSNFTAHEKLIAAQQTTLNTQTKTIADLLARISKLENA